MTTTISYESKQLYDRLKAAHCEFSIWPDGRLALCCEEITFDYAYNQLQRHAPKLVAILKALGHQPPQEIRCRKCLATKLVESTNGLFCRECSAIVFQFEGDIVFEPRR